MKKKLDYKFIYDNSPELIVFADHEGTILEVNRRIFDWLKYRPEDIIGKKFTELEFMDKNTRNTLVEKASQRLEGEKLLPYSIKLVSGDGKTFIGHVAVKPIRDEDGKFLGNLGLISDITAQHEQAMKFRDISEKYRALFLAIPDMIFILKKDGTITDFNPDTEEELAFPIEEIIGRNIGDLDIKDKDMSLIRENIREALQTGDVRTFEYELMTPGREGIYECRMVSLNNDEVLSVIRNITEHKQLDEELKLKNTVFETSISANSTADINGILTHANLSFLDMWGYRKKSEVTGRPLSDFFQNREETDRILLGLKNIGIWRGEFAGKRKDGSLFICQGFASVVNDNSGNVTGYQSTFVDISDKKRLEEARRESENRYWALFEKNIDAVFIFDLNGIHLEANPSAHIMLGYEEGEIVGRHISEFTLARESDDSRGKILSLLKGDFLPVYNRTFVRKNGSEFLGEINISLIYDKEGKPTHFQSIVREIDNL